MTNRVLFRRMALPVCAIVMSVAPAQGRACSSSLNKMTAQQIAKQAHASFRNASLIVDAEVLTPMNLGPALKPGLLPAAHLRVIKTWKGETKLDSILVVYVESCDINLERKGQKVRIALIGSSGVFRASQGMNGAGVSNLTIFNAAMDRFIGNPRSATFAKFPGEEPAPLLKRKLR